MELRTLGALSLEGSTFTRPKPLLLLAYLALEGPQPRSSLTRLFWPTGKNPSDSLSTTLRRLASAHPHLIESEGSRLRTSVPHDAGHLLQALDEKRDEAITLYRGPFLHGVSPSIGEEIDEWVHSTREYLAERVQRLYLERAERSFAAGREHEIRPDAEAAYTLPGAPPLDPGNLERLARLLVVGNSPLAKRAANELGDLGIDFDPTARPDEQVSLHYDRDFVGREHELSTLREYLGDPAVRLVTLHGPGGVGKTRLARHALGLAQHDFETGAYFVELESVSATEEILGAIAAALGLERTSTSTPLDAIAQAIGLGQMLLLLDNLEHIITDSTKVVTELLAKCPNLSILTTSRTRLNIQREWVIALQGLALPEQDAAAEVSRDSDAIRLFLQRARQARHDLSPTGAVLADVVRICRMLDGLPLGIELAAPWVRVMPVAEIASEIARSDELLIGTSGDMRERHRSIRSVFDRSWRLLTDKQRRILAALSVFRGGFTRGAAGAVAEASLPDLVGLVDASLIHVAPDGRYDLHPLVQQYIRERLAAERDVEHSACERHAEYYIGLFEYLNPDQAGRGDAVTPRSLHRDFDNLRAAWLWAAAERPDLLAGTARDLWRFLLSRPAITRADEGLSLANEALRTLSEHNPAHKAAIATALSLASGCNWMQSRYDEARALAEKGIETLSGIDNDKSREFALIALGGSSWKQGEYGTAKQAFEGALALSRQLGLHSSRQLQSVSHIEAALGNAERAIVQIGEAADLNRRCGYLDYLIVDLAYMARLHAELGATDRAVTVAEEAVAIAQQIGNRTLEAFASVALTVALTANARLPAARGVADRALHLTEDIGNLSHRFSANIAVSELALLEGNLEGAHHHAIAALQHARGAPEQLEGLTAVASWQAEVGRDLEAVRLASMAANAPTATATVRRKASDLLAQLEHRLDDGAFSEARRSSQGAPLDEVVRRTLSVPT